MFIITSHYVIFGDKASPAEATAGTQLTSSLTGALRATTLSAASPARSCLTGSGLMGTVSGVRTLGGPPAPEHVTGWKMSPGHGEHM